MSKCWYCNNELTTGDNPKHFGICNKCYDEMFKSSDTIIRSFTNKISDLEAKLAEKDKQINELEFIVEEIEQFVWEQLNNDNFDKYKAYDEMFTKIKQLTRNSPYEKRCQNKISFAIEQLEKVKEKFGYKHNSQLVISSKNLVGFIDQQINELIGDEVV